jgi:magnesium transporter
VPPYQSSIRARKIVAETQETLTGELRERWAALSESDRVRAFHHLPRAEAQALFLELQTRDQYDLLRSLPRGEQRIWLRLLPPDDAADLIQLAAEQDRPRLLSELDDVSRREVSALMAYREDVAGGLMNPRFARLRPDMTADQAISYLRWQSPHVQTIYYAYVLDDMQHLLGVVSFRDLFSADRDRLVRDVMRRDFVAATDDMDQEAVAKLVAAHHLLAVPVIDHQGRMEGIVTVDDVIDVVQEEASEDIQKFGGLEALDAPYLDTGFWGMVKKRAGWLAILFVGEMLTATAMSFFEREIAQAVVLALFVPLIISSGGNSGSQATTLVVRAMALGELRLGDLKRVILRELSTGFVLGCVLALIGMTRILLWQAIWKTYGPHYAIVALTVGLSLVGVVLFGAVAGSMLPFLLRWLRLDPASASAPFVATLVDVTGLVIYFSVASVVMRGVLL